jgi:hypothetical protein
MAWNLLLPEHCDRDPQLEMGLMRLTLARSPGDHEGVRDAPATDDFVKQQTTDEFSKGILVDIFVSFMMD